MKKISKMSLVAAVAIAGMSSTQAKDLTEAIKNVDVSGSIVYRYDDYTSDDANGRHNNNNKYKAVLNLSSKVNNDVKANFSFIATDSTSNNMSSSDTKNSGDENLDVELSKVNFDYSGIKNTNIRIGKQGMSTPFTMALDSDGDTQTGTGIVATTSWSGLTFIGGYYNQTNFDDSATNNAKSGKDKNTGIYGGEEDVIIGGLISNVGPVSLSAWYMGLDDNKTSYTDSTGGATSLVDSSFDAYTLNAKYAFAISNVKMNLGATYSNLEFDDKAAQLAVGGKVNTTENELWKVKLSAKMGIFGASAMYGKTGEDGGYVAIDSSSSATWSGWMADVSGVADATFMSFNVNTDLMPTVNLAVNYNEVDSDFNNDENHKEVYAQLTHKMSANFKTYVRFGQLTETDSSNKDHDTDMGRLQIEYTF